MIVASVDGRGSMGRGDRFLHAVYRQLGTVDVADQLEASRCPRLSLDHSVATGEFTEFILES